MSLATTRLAAPCSAALTVQEREKEKKKERRREKERETEKERARERGRYSSSIVNPVGWYLRSLWSGCMRLSR